jgi:hypothetical protein
VRELEADEEVVEPTGRLAVAVEAGLEEQLEPFGGAVGVVVDHADLVRVRAAVALHGERLAAPDQLRAAASEMVPPADRVLGGLAVGRAVPAFHRVDAPAVADDEPADVHWLRERAARGGGEDLGVDGQVRPDRAQVRGERRDVLQVSDLGKRRRLFGHGFSFRPSSPARCPLAPRPARRNA